MVAREGDHLAWVAFDVAHIRAIWNRSPGLPG